MNFSKEGDVLTVGQEPVLAEGVKGLAFDTPNGIFIPLITAINPGRGDVSRFLDSLPTDRRIVFPNVLNQKLALMLIRRGYTKTVEEGEFGQVDCWQRAAR